MGKYLLDNTQNAKNWIVGKYRKQKYIWQLYSFDNFTQRPESTLFCVIPDGFDKAQAKSLKAVSKMVERNSAKVFDTVEEILNSAYK